jgi:hypothetical protein
MLAGLCTPGSAVSKPKPKLIAIAVAPASATLPKGGYTQQFTATGIYSDSSTSDLSGSVSWQSSNTSVATVDATGTVTSGSTAGSATISARADHGKKIAGAAVVTVNSALLVNLTLTPEAPYTDPVYIAKGGSAKIDAIGTFSDGSTQDISTDVSWTSNNTSRVTVDGAGQISANSIGSATVTARRGPTISDTMPVNVGPAEVRYLEITPAELSISADVNAAAQLHAIAYYTDGSSTDVTNYPDTEWSVDPIDGVLQVQNYPNGGLVSNGGSGVAGDSDRMEACFDSEFIELDGTQITGTTCSDSSDNVDTPDFSELGYPPAPANTNATVTIQ